MGVSIWKCKHSIRWMLISAINNYNDRIDSGDFTLEQARVSSGKRLELDEFIVVKVSKNSGFKPTKPDKLARLWFFIDT